MAALPPDKSAAKPASGIADELFYQEEQGLYDTASERIFLAMLVRRPELILEAERLVPADAIYRRGHAAIYRCMLHVQWLAVQHGWPLRFDDMAILRVADWAGMREVLLAETQNLQHVRDIMAIAERVDVEQFSSVVYALTDASHRVKLYRQARVLQLGVMNRDEHPDARQVALQTESAMLAVAFDGVIDDDSRMTKLGEEREQFEAKAEMAADVRVPGLFNIPCPLFPRWMALMNGGFRRKGLTIVAARPKVGKSTLMQEIARSVAAISRVPVLYLDTEMSREEIYSRALSAESQLPEFELLRGQHLHHTDKSERVSSAMDRLVDAPLYYCNVNGKPVEYAVSVMQQFRTHVVGNRTVEDRNGRPVTLAGQGLVVYDWIKLPGMEGLRDAAEHQLLGDLCMQLKDAGRRMDLPVIAAAQSNRGAVGMSAKDFVTEGEKYVAGSDRLLQFCTCLCLLRNLDLDEGEKLLETYGERQTDLKDPRARMPFNQVLHMMAQRQGPDCRTGIPLYIGRGTATYQEMSWDAEGNPTGYEEYLAQSTSRKKIDRSLADAHLPSVQQIEASIKSAGREGE